MNLSDLRDIVEPATVGWWPLAPGMVLLIMLLMLWMGTACILWWWRWQQNAYRREAVGELAAIKDRIRSEQNRTQGLRELSSLLKRVALAAYPRAKVAALYGKDWIDFLDAQAAGRLFAKGPGSVLAAAMADPRAGRDLADADCEALIHAARQWITRHRVDNLPKPDKGV